MEHKKGYIIGIIILAIVVVGLILALTVVIINNSLIKGDTNNAIHAVISKENVILKSGWDEIVLQKGDRVGIIKEDIINNTYTIKYGDKTGEVSKEDVKYFEFDEDERESLMLDVSQFNIVGKESEDNPNKNFKDEKEFELFILNNNIQYVYIRLGGRGWGQKGVLYYDDEAPRYVESCEYLGIPYGFYYLDEALDDKEIQEEVQFVKDFLDKNSTKMNVLPLAIDLEYQSGKGRTDGIWEERTAILNKLIAEFKKENINCIIYANGARIEKYIKGVNTEFWVAMYPQKNIIPEESYKATVKLQQLEEQVNSLSNNNLFSLINRGGTEIKTYSDEFLNKVIGWQFTESGASEDGIEDYIDLSIVNSKSLKKYFK